MLAARDQENLVHGHHQAAASKPLNQSTRGLQPKTPGNKYPKTPFKIPLNDENAPTGFGKTIKGKGIENLVTGGKKNATFDKNAFITPMGPRTRAPLGMKTTNAKAKAFQTPAGPAPEKELEKTQPKQQTSARRPKKNLIHADQVKLEVHGDESPLTDRDVEYCPPKPKDLPYQSEDFPDNCLDYRPLQRGNLMRGIYDTYYRNVDENGTSKLERKHEEAYQRSAQKADEQILAMLEEEWTVGDVPETFRHLRKKQAQPLEPKPKADATIKKQTTMTTKGPATIASRKAASALSVAPKSAPLAPKTTKPASKPFFLSRAKPAPAPSNPSNASTMRHSAAVAASRSTIGYTKGRSASGALSTNTFRKPEAKPERRPERSGFARSVSNMSQASDTTITPARFKEEEEWRNPSFMKAFEVDDEDLEPVFRGVLPESLRRSDDDEEEWVMTLKSTE